MPSHNESSACGPRSCVQIRHHHHQVLLIWLSKLSSPDDRSVYRNKWWRQHGARARRVVQPAGVRPVVPELRRRTGKRLEVPVPRVQEWRWCVWGLLHGGTDENLEVTRAAIGVQTM